MKKIYIVHGWDGSPESDWIGWATKELGALGYSVNAPRMPHPEKPDIKEWVGYLRSVVISLDEETIFIGHSIGCQAIMRFLEGVDIKIMGAIFVAGWFNLINLEGPEAEAIAEPWISTPIDLGKVRNNLSRSIVLLGDNDPWVSYEETKNEFESKLGAEIITIHDGGHITPDDGFGPFPQLLEVFQNNFK